MRWVVPQYSMVIPTLAPNIEHVIVRTITIPRTYQYSNNQQITLQPGSYKLHAIINTTNFQPGEEENPGNNEFIKRFDVRNPPPSDLVLDYVKLVSNCRIKIRMHNAGSAIPNQDFSAAWVQIKKDDGTQEQKELSVVDPAGLLKMAGNSWPPTQHSVNYVWPMGTQHYHVKMDPGETASIEVILDAYTEIRDSKRGNNSKTVTLTCPE
jgi:hypothetical protein